MTSNTFAAPRVFAIVTLGLCGLVSLSPSAGLEAADGNDGSSNPTPAAAVPSPTSPARFQLDTEASRVFIKVGAERYGHIHGVQGRLAQGDVTLGGKGELVFDMSTFTADLPEARDYFQLTKKVSASDQKKTTANMLGRDVLDVAHHPRAVLAITSATPLDRQAPGTLGRYQLNGTFMLHGVTRRLPLTVSVDSTSRPGVVRMRGNFAILQSQFGITPYSALGGIVRVADKLEIYGELVLRQSAP